eukprot:733038-Amphidinium_carterae.2
MWTIQGAQTRFLKHLLQCPESSPPHATILVLPVIRVHISDSQLHRRPCTENVLEDQSVM